jgi:uncharacterized protein YecT (DUF1311 family)
MAKIAISYRRLDSQDITGRIFDRLAQAYGKSTVFRDIDSILPGIDFRIQIDAALKATDVLLVIVGPHWLGRSDGAASRMDNEADPVRIEVETALKRDIPIIPVLVSGMKMPEPAELPESLRDFAFRHAVTVDGGRDFDHHIDGLIRALNQFFAARGITDTELNKIVLGDPPLTQPPFWQKYGFVGALAAIVAVVAVFLLYGQMRRLAVSGQTTSRNVSATNANPLGMPPATPALSQTGLPPSNPNTQISVTPSFDCMNRGNATEREICNVGELALLDRELSVLYTAARHRLDGDAQKTLVSDENGWRAQRDDCGSNDDCIRDAYRSRIAQLQALH